MVLRFQLCAAVFELLVRLPRQTGRRPHAWSGDQGMHAHDNALGIQSVIFPQNVSPAGEGQP